MWLLRDFDVLVCRFLELEKRLADHPQLCQRLSALEAEVAALRPLLDSDRLEVARVCQAVGAALADLRSRAPSKDRAQRVGRVFVELRQRGWSLDRIARTTGYTARGVLLSLQRSSRGVS